jgi:hypothetical protein
MMSDEMKVSKGMKFPVVALPGVGHMLANGEDEQQAARMFCVGATRATQRLVTGGGWGIQFYSSTIFLNAPINSSALQLTYSKD